nr:MAG TPA: Thymidylate synthase complementing protein [Caudoviricetes sp.]
MKLINQSFEILEQKDFTLKGIKQFIEKCGRVCYKSEDKITDTSYEKFVDMLVKRDHARPLEFGTVYLKYMWNGKVCKSCNQVSPNKILDRYCNNKYSIVKYHGNDTYITTNYRVIIENGWEDDLKYLCEPTEYHAKRYTVHFITNRVTMDSFRTHITLSHLGESTRYCSYDKDRFGNEITCVIPCYCSDLIEGNSYDLSICEYGLIQTENLSEKSAKWVESMCQAEQDYMDLINDGCTAQEARDVLPLGIKSELISCGFKEAWSNFFYRRCDNAAHPMARELACGLKEEFIKRGYKL